MSYKTEYSYQAVHENEELNSEAVADTDVQFTDVLPRPSGKVLYTHIIQLVYTERLYSLWHKIYSTLLQKSTVSSEWSCIQNGSSHRSTNQTEHLVQSRASWLLYESTNIQHREWMLLSTLAYAHSSFNGGQCSQFCMAGFIGEHNLSFNIMDDFSDLFAKAMLLFEDSSQFN